MSATTDTTLDQVPAELLDYDLPRRYPTKVDDVGIGSTYFHEEQTIDSRGVIGWWILWIVKEMGDTTVTVLKVHRIDEYEFATGLPPPKVTFEVEEMTYEQLFERTEACWLEDVQLRYSVGATRRHRQNMRELRGEEVNTQTTG